jgi:hypothetical protein
MDLPITYTDEEALVVVGVDTHACAHVAVALDGFGRHLGHKTVPATEAGYTPFWRLGRRSSERWSASASKAAAASALLGSPASCAPGAWRSSRSTARTASTGAGSASTTPPTPRPPRGRCRRTPPPASPRRAPTDPQRWCVPCTWCGVRRSRGAPKPRTSCARCSSLRPKNSRRSCAVFPRPSWSPPRRAFVWALTPKTCGPRPSWR